MQKNVLIVGQSDDPHVDVVMSHLRTMGASPVVFEISKHLIELSVASGVASGYFFADGKKINFDSIHSVWWRLKQWCDQSENDAAVRSEERFAWQEWTETLQSLPSYVARGRWINNIHDAQLIARKAAQHILASEIGFRVPETAITNDAESVIRLFGRNKRVIYKPNKSPNLSHCRVVFTNEIDPDIVLSSTDEIRIAPGIFQELVEKDYELRVMIVGENIFPVRINSQTREITQIDWRRSQLGPGMYEKATLDTATASRLLEFHKKAKLVYGAYDLIVTKSGEPVFLEVNPGGQWLWMEEALGIPVAKEVAARLAAA
jgi:glutathione synthase/RimK-type ligase-like ATP-grasp enzyme